MKKFFQNHKALCCVLLFDILMIFLPLILPFMSYTIAHFIDIRKSVPLVIKLSLRNLLMLISLLSFIISLVSFLISSFKKIRKFSLKFTSNFFINSLICLGLICLGNALFTPEYEENTYSGNVFSEALEDTNNQ